MRLFRHLADVYKRQAFFPDNYVKVSVKKGNRTFAEDIYVGGLSVLINSFESESVINGLVCRCV